MEELENLRQGIISCSNDLAAAYRESIRRRNRNIRRYRAMRLKYGDQHGFYTKQIQFNLRWRYDRKQSLKEILEGLEKMEESFRQRKTA